MKSVIPLIAVVLLASSCSTAYKSGQTPDDVYFSPEPKPVAARSHSNGNDYVQMDRENSRQYRSNRRQQQEYSDPYGYYDDRYLRMKVRNRRMWSDLDYYYSDPYAYRYSDPFWGSVGLWGTYNYWNPYMAWGYNYNPYYYNPYYYSPYGGKVIVGRPVSPVYSRPRTSNMNVFSRPNSPVYRGSQFPSGSGYGNNNNRTYSQPRDFGNDIRRSFGNNNNNNSFSSPSRSTINNGSSSGSSGSSSGGSRGGSAPVRRF